MAGGIFDNLFQTAPPNPDAADPLRTYAVAFAVQSLGHSAVDIPKEEVLARAEAIYDFIVKAKVGDRALADRLRLYIHNRKSAGAGLNVNDGRVMVQVLDEVEMVLAGDPRVEHFLAGP